jgi:flagellum-specific peptidoglycan hydrolase FlgJ
MYQQIIYDTLIGQKIPPILAKIVTAQAQFESGNFKSNVFLKDNNAFGYKYVGQKIATKGIPSPASEGDNYARYNNVQDSAIEIANWLKRRVREKKLPALEAITTPAQYSKLIKAAGYYGASENTYTKGITKIFNSLKIGPVVTGLTGLIIIAAIFFFIKRK